MRTTALMQVADGRLELTECEVPPVGRDSALLEVESCGLCGSDVEQFKGDFVANGLVRHPLIPGHEPIGRIAETGAEAARTLLVRSPGTFAQLHTHSFPLERQAEAIKVLTGERGEGAICISIHP